MRTEIIKIKGDWEEVANDCRTTVGKGDLGKEPSQEFKRKILLSEHSPIRDLIVKWRWDNIKYWISTHWARHKFEKFVKTQRTDRTGVNRDDLPQGAKVTMTIEANSQHLIDAFRKRLCYQASSETRQYAEDFKFTLHDYEPELADVLVPNCVYRCGCPEMKTCGLWKHWVEKTNGEIGTSDIQKRYDLYNAIFKGGL